jgi:hypothetical protein
MKTTRFVDLTCKDVTDLITDYMSDALTTEFKLRFEQHLYACTWCMTYLDQMHQTIQSTKAPAPAAISPDTEARMKELFQRWKQNKP